MVNISHKIYSDDYFLAKYFLLINVGSSANYAKAMLKNRLLTLRH